MHDLEAPKAEAASEKVDPRDLIAEMTEALRRCAAPFRPGDDSPDMPWSEQCSRELNRRQGLAKTALARAEAEAKPALDLAGAELTPEVEQWASALAKADQASPPPADRDSRDAVLEEAAELLELLARTASAAARQNYRAGDEPELAERILGLAKNRADAFTDAARDIRSLKSSPVRQPDEERP